MLGVRTAQCHIDKGHPLRLCCFIGFYRTDVGRASDGKSVAAQLSLILHRSPWRHNVDACPSCKFRRASSNRILARQRMLQTSGVSSIRAFPQARNRAIADGTLCSRAPVLYIQAWCALRRLRAAREFGGLHTCMAGQPGHDWSLRPLRPTAPNCSPRRYSCALSYVFSLTSALSSCLHVRCTSWRGVSRGLSGRTLLAARRASPPLALLTTRAAALMRRAVAGHACVAQCPARIVRAAIAPVQRRRPPSFSIPEERLHLQNPTATTSTPSCAVCTAPPRPPPLPFYLRLAVTLFAN